MILVDTSVWIDHLHEPVPRLVAALESDEVGCHPLVIEELALGSLKRRVTVSSCSRACTGSRCSATTRCWSSSGPGGCGAVA